VREKYILERKKKKEKRGERKEKVREYYLMDDFSLNVP
jgi:hypothetical protein